MTKLTVTDTECDTTTMLDDAQRLKSFLLGKASACILQPREQLTQPFVISRYDAEVDAAPGSALQMFDWDAFFFSQAAARLGHNELADCVVFNFLSFARDDGFIPRVVTPEGPQYPSEICKPFISQSLLHQHVQSASLTFPEHLEKIHRYYEYFFRNRRHESGLFRWSNALESGIDNNLSLLAPTQDAGACEFIDNGLLPVDLNCYLASDFESFSLLCSAIGSDELSEKYTQRSQDLIEAIETTLWNEELSLYCSFDPNSNQQIAVRSWTGLTPLAYGLAAPNRAEQMLSNNVMSDEQFLRPAGLSSTAISEPLCNQSPAGLYGRRVVSNWQGPVWVLPNVLLVRGLKKYDWLNEATAVAFRTVSTMIQDLEETGQVHQCWHAESGKGLGNPGYMGWNILALELIDLVQ